MTIITTRTTTRHFYVCLLLACFAKTSRVTRRITKNNNTPVIFQESDEKFYFPVLQQLGKHIRASTTSMTSVPKPLKFMRPHYGTMKEIYTKLTSDEAKKACADVISVLAMTMGEKRECLKYRLLSDMNNIGEWGHEYVRYVRLRPV